MGATVPTWADIIAIATALGSGAYTFGVMGQRVKALEDKALKAEDLEHDFHELTNRFTGMEVTLKNLESMMSEIRTRIMQGPR